MAIRDNIARMIEKAAPFPCTITENTDLYTDLGFDSLAFTELLIEIEEAFSITFSIAEMQSCLQVGKLIDSTGKKLKVCE